MVVAYVAPGSSAEAAGVKVGDLVARVNGRDVTYSSQENVHSILKYSQVREGVGRVGEGSDKKQEWDAMQYSF